MLLLAALVWGIAFVAQSEGLNYVETFTFNTCRFLLGGAVLIPCIFFMHGRKDSIWQTLSEKEKKEQTRMGIIGGICCGCVLCLASCLQQFGIGQTTVGKAGFITAMYIILVPVLSLFLHKKAGIKLWISVVVAVAGLYLLCMSGSLQLQKGDLLVLLCAAAFGAAMCAVLSFSGDRDAVAECDMSIAVTLLLGVLALSVAMPLNYRLGPERARPWMYVIIFAPIVVLLGGAKLGLFDGIDLSWLDQLPELAVLGVFALVPLVPLVGMLLSCWISCRIYARKEF